MTLETKSFLIFDAFLLVFAFDCGIYFLFGKETALALAAVQLFAVLMVLMSQRRMSHL